MKTLNLLFTITGFILFLLTFSTANADSGAGTKTADLNTQIVQEIKDVLQTPYLRYADKNLNGEVEVFTSINENGKIVFKDVKGINENLKSNVVNKLNSLNLWTSPDYNSNTFKYLIKYKN